MKAINLQDLLLNRARKDRIPVTMYLTNGFQFKGSIVGFDSYVVVMECDGKQYMVYKHAISTVIPFKHISLQENPEEEVPADAE